MGRADSIDLRKRVVAAVETGGLSRLQAAAQFEARRFLWIQRFRRTSNVKPIRMGDYKPRQIAGRLTTTGWCADAGRPTSLARTGRRIGRERPKVDCRVHREKLRHKKRSSSPSRPDIVRRRTQWCKYRSRINPARLVFIDVIWSPRGQLFKAKAPLGHWQTLTFLAALRHDRVTAP